MAEDRPKPAIVEPEVEERPERAEPPQKRLGLEEPGVDAPDGGFDLVLRRESRDKRAKLAYVAFGVFVTGRRMSYSSQSSVVRPSCACSSRKSGVPG